MNWLTTIWYMAASACLTLALIHLVVWLLHRDNRVHLLFAAAAGAVAGIAVCEVQMMRAQTAQQFGWWLRGAHVPLFFAVVSVVWFVRAYFQAGRLWLAWSYCALRFFCLALNFIYSPNFNYSEITGVRQVQAFGGGTVAVAEGVLSERTRIGQFASVLLLVYVIDAVITVWRRRDVVERRRALTVGLGIVFFCLGASVQVALLHAGVIKTPYMITLAFLVPIAAAAYQLAVDVVRAGLLGSELDRSRAELSDSTQSMDLAANAAGLAMWKWDGDKEEIWMSERGKLLFGLGGPDSVSLERFLHVLHPEDRETMVSAVVSTTRRDDDYQSEFRVIMPDGRQKWVVSRGRVEFNGRATPIRMHGVSMDVTARKEAEELLRQSEALFHEMADAAPVLLWMSGQDKRCTYFNKGWLEFTGRALEQETGDGWTRGVHPEDLAHCLDVYVSSFDAGIPFTMEYRLRGADGEYRWVLDSGVPRRALGGTVLGYIGSAIDITERKRTEERVRQIVEVAPSAIVMVDSRGVIRLVNAQAQAVFGYTSEELLGQPVEMLVPERYRAEHPKDSLGYISDSKARATGAERELSGLRKDGSEVPIGVGLSPFSTSEGTFLLASIVDLTERKALEREQMLQRNELFHLSRVATLGELLGSLSHELQQPLTAILTNAQAAQEMLAAPPADLDEIGEVLHDIVSEDKRAGEVIRRLRLLFRKGEVRYEALDLNELVLDVLRLMNSDLLHHNVTVESDLAPDVPKVRGDRVQLQQVLINLILNATDAMSEATPTDRRLRVRTRLDDLGGIIFSIADTGTGIPATQIERVFEPFHTTKPKGTGLGLAVCRTIIAAHSGKIWAANNPDRGACFHVALSPVPAGAAV